MSLRVLGRLALIAILAALLAPVAARAMQQQPVRIHPSHPRHSTEPRIVREVEKGGEEVAKEAEDEPDAPAAINFTDFSNNKQPPYAAALINFGLLAFLYYSLGKKPVAEALKNRRATVVKEIEEAQRMKREAEERAKEYKTKLANLEDELASTRAALHDAGEGERQHIVQEAEEKAARMQKDSAFLLEQELKQMRMDLQREMVDLATQAAEDLLKKRVTADDQERLAEEFLRSLETERRGAA